MNKATLTVEQDRRYGQLFEIALSEGMTDLESDESAWQGLLEEWPELAPYDGAEKD